MRVAWYNQAGVRGRVRVGVRVGVRVRVRAGCRVRVWGQRYDCWR